MTTPALRPTSWVVAVSGIPRRKLYSLATSEAKPVAGKLRVRYLRNGPRSKRYWVARDVLELCGEP